MNILQRTSSFRTWLHVLGVGGEIPGTPFQLCQVVSIMSDSLRPHRL